MRESVVAMVMTALLLVADRASAAPLEERARTEQLRARTDTSTALGWTDVLALAKAQAPAVRVAAAKLRQAEAEVSVADAAWLPTVAGTGAATLFASRGSFVVSGVESKSIAQAFGWGEAGLSARWVAFDFGARGSLQSAATHGANAARLEKEAEELGAMLLAGSAFVSIVADDALVEVTRHTAVGRERQLTTTRELETAGIRSPLDVVRAEIALQSAELDVTTARAARARDGAALAGLLSLATPSIDVADGSRQRVAPSPAQAAEEALERRPELAAARHRASQAESRRDAASARLYPTLSVQGSGSVRYTRALTADGAGPAEVASGSVVLDVPIFDGTLRAQARQSTEAHGTALAETERRMREVRAEAMHAAVAVEEAVRQVAQANRLATATRAALAQAEARYAAGLIGPLEISDATATDATARAAVVRATKERDLAEVRVLAATGRLGR